MTDRLREISERYAVGWDSTMSRMRDIAWLLGEVERLRAERAQVIADAATAVAELRANDAAS